MLQTNAPMRLDALTPSLCRGNYPHQNVTFSKRRPAPPEALPSSTNDLHRGFKTIGRHAARGCEGMKAHERSWRQAATAH